MSMTSAEHVNTQAVFPVIETDSSLAGFRRPGGTALSRFGPTSNGDHCDDARFRTGSVDVSFG
jgi:hypothetical protein